MRFPIVKGGVGGVHGNRVRNSGDQRKLERFTGGWWL